jgi:ribonuclease E
MKMLMPSHAKNVKLYKEPRPLFSRYQTETQLDTLYSPTVTLPSGGYLVINQTEALVSIDINSGKATREHNIEDTALKTNLEACDEIARQLRLRDLAGLVVIDFIDMEENRNNRSVERRLKEALKNDRARIQVGRISHFGLMEMSRQRLRPGLLEGSSRPCPHCEGRGIVRSISSCGLSVLRAIEEHLMNKRAENLTVKCPREVAFYVLNEKRDNLLNIEQTYGISVFIVPSDELKGSQAVIERAGDREHIQRRVMAPPVRIDSAFPDEEPEEEVAAEAEDETETSEESSSDGETDSRVNGQSGDDDGNGGRRRRRRGRRGGRRGGRDRGEERGEGLETARSQGDGQSSGSGDEDEDSSVPAVREPRGDESEMEDRPTDSNPEDAAAEPEGDAGEGGEADGGQRRDRGRRGRRDRFGRNRNRGDREGRPPREDRGERPPREDRGERPPREDNGERRHRREEPMLSATPPQPAPVIIIPEPQPDPEPRKWQPPAANVTAQPAERKAGWWSKRK